MITALLILTVVVWLPVFLYLMSNHSFITHGSPISKCSSENCSKYDQKGLT